MRAFTQQCLERTAWDSGLTEDQVQDIVRRGKLAASGRLPSGNLPPDWQLTPFYEQFKTTSAILERATQSPAGRFCSRG